MTTRLVNTFLMCLNRDTLVSEVTMNNVNVRPVRDLRNRYSEVEALLENHDPVVITKNGRGVAVLINFEDYAGVEEYLHYKYVAEKLQEAETAAASPGVKWLDYKTALNGLREKYRGV